MTDNFSILLDEISEMQKQIKEIHEVAFKYKHRYDMLIVFLKQIRNSSKFRDLDSEEIFKVVNSMLEEYGEN
jgi:hypothetical protein